MQEGIKNMAGQRTGRWRLEQAGLIFPAVALGVLAMIHGGVPPVLWGQQIAAFFVFALLANGLRHAGRRAPAAAWTALLLLVLALSLLGEEAGGARRWLDLGIFHVHAAMLTLPALIAALCVTACPHPVLLGAAVVLSIQPDLAQLTAFSAAAVVIIVRCRRTRLWCMGSLLMLAGLVFWCVGKPVALEPVPYCEGILAMLGDVSPLLKTAGIISLAAIPAGFVIGFLKEKQLALLSLSVYYAVLMLFVLSGNEPTPFMGFGLSPIAGYFLIFLCGLL